MKNPLWFKASCWGRVPVHWTPVAWQGWAVVAVYVAALYAGLSLRRTPAPMIAVECGLVVLLITVAALTDDRGRQ